MFSWYKKLMNDIKEFKKYKNRNWDSTTVNCRRFMCVMNKEGLCTNGAILLEDVGGENLTCICFTPQRNM